jgi:hypothetical protein
MGIPRHPPSIMEWMSTLAMMKKHGTLVMRTCSGPCRYHVMMDVDAMIAAWGPEARLQDERPPCPQCSRLNHFMVTTGESTPFRPLLSRDIGPQPPAP